MNIKMKIIHSDLKKGEIKVAVENLDDLWYLSQIIDQGDLIKGKTVRKIKIGQEEERSAKVIKKSVFLKTKIEKIEFSKTSDILRISGKIIEAPDDIPKGDYHTFNVELNSIITVVKEKWMSFQLDKLKDASTETSKILIVVHDREEAFFALMKKYGYDLLSHITGNVPKKGIDEKIKTNFYLEIINQIQEYVERYKNQTVILASPAFWKEDLLKELKDENLRKKIITATCSSVDKTGINEVLKRDELKKALQNERLAKEINLVEQLLTEIAKNNLAVYGIKDTEEAIKIGAVDTLLVSDTLIMKLRQENSYEKLDNLLKITDKNKAKIFIISSEHEAGKKLDGLGGIAAILRFKLHY